jgi:hypothetical protein
MIPNMFRQLVSLEGIGSPLLADTIKKERSPLIEFSVGRVAEWNISPSPFQESAVKHPLR